ncbi:transcription termination factor MTERF15, mitochondrial-like [Malania oleifera]|uniref:transcription termination factor MTERF15, mitochondrial-like n=1 Tax=Malania oleifera TaxID=397392 RepID=UPI0025AE3B22|nr:transcription termination factor MTERF15, mitochondrial-like [Malania oleifera]
MHMVHNRWQSLFSPFILSDCDQTCGGFRTGYCSATHTTSCLLQINPSLPFTFEEMLHLLCKRKGLIPLLLVNPCKRNKRSDIDFAVETVTKVGFYFSLRNISFSQKKSCPSAQVEQPESHSFTVSYLINSCGLSPKSAISASKSVYFETPERADAVLAFLRKHGFIDAQISQVIRDAPWLLAESPDRALLPKLQFFLSLGMPAADVAMILSSNPRFFKCSLNNRLIPNYNFLKSVVQDKDIASALRKGSRLFFCQDVQKNVAPNISVLRKLGVHESLVAVLVSHTPSVVGRNAESFEDAVKKVVRMGFNPLRLGFIQAVQVILGMNESTLKHKEEVYGRWGLLEEEIWLAFRKHPLCMKLSDKNIMNVMDYLVNRMGWQPAAVARCPWVLNCSLEKRIIPRSSVVKVLLLKGLINHDVSLGQVFLKPENFFLDRFVSRYQEHVPLLLDIYQGKIDPLKLDFGSDKISGINQS